MQFPVNAFPEARKLLPVLAVLFLLIIAFFMYSPHEPNDILSRSGVFSDPDSLHSYLDSSNISSKQWPVLVHFLYPVVCPDSFAPLGSSAYVVLADTDLSKGLKICISDGQARSMSEFFFDTPIELSNNVSYPSSFSSSLSSLPLEPTDFLESFSYKLVPTLLFEPNASDYSRTPVWFFTVQDVRSKETVHYILRGSDNSILFNATLEPDMVPVYR